jgi:hypothetical protein
VVSYMQGTNKGNRGIRERSAGTRKMVKKGEARMNTRKLSIVAAGLMMLGASALGAESVTDEQKARLAEIERYIATQKQNIENRYAAKLVVLNEQMRSGLLPLEVGDNRKFIRSGFLGWTRYVQEVLRLDGVDLSNDEDFAQTFRKFRGSRLSAANKLDQTPRLLAIAERRLADEQIRVRRLFALERAQIEKERRYAIEVRLAELEAKLKDDVLNPPRPGPQGMVTGIVYSQDKPAVVIGSQVVHLGEQIDGVRVTAISPDSVEFEKAGKRWTQGVNVKPGSEW